MTRPLSVLCVLLAMLSGCGLIYKQNIQQGNALEDEDLEQLYLGMNQRQVLFVLGSPSIHDPFQPQRWDYIQTFSRRGGEPVQRTVTLIFENDQLKQIIGFELPAAEAPSAAAAAPSAATAAPSGATRPDPHAVSVEAAEEEVMEPEIKGVGERSAEDRDYDSERDVTNQRAPDDITSPDIDG